MNPLISIITVCFNSAKTIRQTIESVLIQTYTNIEYILVDGKSTDNTVAIIEEYAPQFAAKGIIYRWISEPDDGMYNALNKGFYKSSGEIMYWLNSDDLLLFPYSIKLVIRTFYLYPSVNWVTFCPGLYNTLGEYGCLPSFFASYNRYLIKKGYYHNKAMGFIQQESTFWRRNLWEKSGGKIDESFKLAGDFHLWKKFANYEPLYKVNLCVAGFRKHSNNKSGDLQEYYNEIINNNGIVAKIIKKLKFIIILFSYSKNKKYELNSHTILGIHEN
jgi:glycosyltransferase involved in cell wall biosynthesis